MPVDEAVGGELRGVGPRWERIILGDELAQGLEGAPRDAERLAERDACQGERARAPPAGEVELALDALDEAPVDLDSVATLCPLADVDRRTGLRAASVHERRTDRRHVRLGCITVKVLTPRPAGVAVVDPFLEQPLEVGLELRETVAEMTAHAAALVRPPMLLAHVPELAHERLELVACNRNLHARQARPSPAAAHRYFADEAIGVLPDDVAASEGQHLRAPGKGAGSVLAPKSLAIARTVPTALVTAPFVDPAGSVRSSERQAIGANAEPPIGALTDALGCLAAQTGAMIPEWLVVEASPQFRDRCDAGRRLAEVLRAKDLDDAVVVGLARGGIVVAAEVASALHLALDVVAVRKVGHPLQPELAIGAVAPGNGVYLRGGDELEPEEREAIVQAAKRAAADLDRRLHSGSPPLDLRGRTALLVDDGLATGATMIAAARWARGEGAARVVAAVPVAAAQTIEVVSHEVDEVVCPHPLERFYAVGVWYEIFEQVEDDEVIRLLEAARSEPPVPAGSPFADRSGPRPMPDASA